MPNPNKVECLRCLDSGVLSEGTANERMCSCYFAGPDGPR